MLCIDFGCGPRFMNARYVHTNLTARDWRALASFYCEVFGCVPKPPERDLSGDFLERLTAVPNAHLRGMHLLLPGHGANGPTLEIFAYDSLRETSIPAVNQPGFGHIAFLVEDVNAALEAVLKAGGSTVGELVRHRVEGVGLLEVVYARDPEGNIVEVQRWSP